jgi:hypothetical protein
MKRFGQVVSLLPPELQPLAKYFERNYVGTFVTAPVFPISFWNAYSRVLDGIPRTSNSAEGFHNRLNRSLSSKRPPMWRFLSLIMKFQHSTESSLTKISKGGLPRLQRPKYRALNYRLQEICKKYNSRMGTLKFRNWISRIAVHLPNNK